MSAKLTPHELRAVSVAAAIDPRTVRRYLAGHLVRPSSKTRIVRALRELGFSTLIQRELPGVTS